jgi:uncharacterized protein YbjT (DUF2867 family)
MAKVALVAGSTGLIGGQLLELLLADSNYQKVIAISRSPLPIQNSKLINVVCNLDELQNHSSQLKADDVFCCLGTTMKKAKSKAAFRAVDFEAPLALAKITKVNGANNFLLVSALGANKNSGIFYNQVKGEVEEAIQQVGFKSLHIFRPSLLLGPRIEQRGGEDAAKIFYKIFGWVIPAKYQAIESITVARAMQSLAHQGEAGTSIHESSSLQKF